jgi:hypothetical protein
MEFVQNAAPEAKQVLQRRGLHGPRPQAMTFGRR